MRIVPLLCRCIPVMLAAGCRSATPVGAKDRLPASTPMDTIAQANVRTVQQILATLGDRQRLPAESVFRNVQYLKAVPARTFLSIMSGGYARALGVSCSHCHVPNDFASDDKRPKRAAREMQAMHRMINTQLAQMENLKTPKTENRAISCITCHRGAVNPMAPPR